ncbi:MAG: hypothetical protein ABIJ75_07175 [Actinomycetota bacterium]
MSYASNTEVSPGRSREEIERLLTRYGAGQFMYGWDDSQAMVGFTVEGRMVKFLIPMPDRHDPEFVMTPARKTRRSPEAAVRAWEQAQRQKWRALKLVIQAKLEAVEAGITTFDEEFLAHLVLPSGETVGDVMIPRVAEAYLTGKMPMLALGDGR